jgi:hypothetical protein
MNYHRSVIDSHFRVILLNFFGWTEDFMNGKDSQGCTCKSHCYPGSVLYFAPSTRKPFIKLIKWIVSHISWKSYHGPDVHCYLYKSVNDDASYFDFLDCLSL